METRTMNNLRVVKALLFQKRGLVCEICGRETLELQLHHHLIHRMKGHPELDCEENCSLVCSNCHEARGNSFESRQRFWARQKERGYDMDGWLKKLHLKAKESYD